MGNISLQEQFSLPLVKDLMKENDKLRKTATLGTKIPDSEIEKITVPYKFENKLIMAAGTHNQVTYSKEDLLTKVEEANESHLVLDHLDTKGDEGVSSWAGKIENARWDTGEQGEGIYADLVILDKPIAQKLASGAKWGVSPTIDFEKNETETGEILASDLKWKSFSFVLEPAVRATMLNEKNKEVKPMTEETKKTDPQAPKTSEDTGKTEKTEEVLELLKEKDNKIKELQKYKDTVENDKKQKLVSELASNEFLIGRIDESELENRNKTLSEKSIEVLSELQEVIGSHAELGAFGTFVKDFMKKNPGKSVKDAATAWKTKDGAKLETETDENRDTKENSSLTKNVKSRDVSELASKQSPNVTNADVAFYNQLVKNVPGGIPIK